MPTVGKMMTRLRRTLTLPLTTVSYLEMTPSPPPHPYAHCYWSLECLSRRYEQLKVETVSLAAPKHVRADPTLNKFS